MIKAVLTIEKYDYFLLLYHNWIGSPLYFEYDIIHQYLILFLLNSSTSLFTHIFAMDLFISYQRHKEINRDNIKLISSTF